MKCGVTALFLLIAASPAAAQMPGPTTGGPAPARPAENRPVQNPAPPPVSNPFLGSVPQGTPSAEPIPLTVKDAVERALRNNLGLLLQEESASAARGARWRALAELLPDFSGSLGERRQV